MYFVKFYSIQDFDFVKILKFKFWQIFIIQINKYLRKRPSNNINFRTFLSPFFTLMFLILILKNVKTLTEFTQKVAHIVWLKSWNSNFGKINNVTA